MNGLWILYTAKFVMGIIFFSTFLLHVWDQVSISSTFYEQILCQQIPNAQKKTVKSALSFYAFGLCEGKSCTQNVDEIDP